MDIPPATYKMNKARAGKILERIETLATISDRSDCLSREFGSEAGMKVNELVGQWMIEAGLAARVDNIGNVRGFRNYHRKQLFLMGSHLDTVVNAGKFDGPLGVLMAIDQAERLSDLDFTHDLEVVGFSDEEGVRFKKSYLGSSVLAGTFATNCLELQDQHQTSLKDAITGLGKSPDSLPEDALSPSRVAGYFEVHIEQGPVLDNLNLPVGLVTSIVGQQRHQVTFQGIAGHAGTVPMHYRRDALLAAAQLIMEVEQTAKDYHSMVGTVGKLQVAPGASNVIPEQVTLSIDIRHPEPPQLYKAVSDLRAKVQKIATDRQLLSYWEIIQEHPPTPCDHSLNDKLRQAILSCGLPIKELSSGAGHDAVAISAIAPVCMLFVRCKEGISHNPLEETSLEDIAAAISVCDRFMDSL